MWENKCKSFDILKKSSKLLEYISAGGDRSEVNCKLKNSNSEIEFSMEDIRE